MKKWKSAALLLAVLCGLLCGCGAEEEKMQEKQETQVVESGDSVTEAATTEPEELIVTVAETVIYDADGVKITATGLEENWLGGKLITTDLKLLVENTTDHNIMLSNMNVDVIVNGVTVPGYLDISIAAGETVDGALKITGDYLETAGITKIATIFAKDAYIYDTDSFETLMQTPFEVITSLGEDYVQTVDQSGDVLYEAEGITITSKGISEEFFGKQLILLVNNESGKDVTVEVDNISANGNKIDLWVYDTVFAETVRFSELNMNETTLAESGVTEIENVSFTIKLIDSNSYNTIAQSDTLQVFAKE